MENASQRIKFNAEFFCIPRISERIMFHELSSHLLEDREEEKRLHSFLSTLDLDDPISVTCKVSQIIHFDHTMVDINEQNSGVVNEKAIGVLYLDELNNEDICPTGAP